MSLHEDTDIVKAVHDHYSEIAKQGEDEVYSRRVAEAFGYTEEQLRSLPEKANMGLSCGNPVAVASIQEGEVIVDLGSGGGLDVFLAAVKAGSKGQVIGLDLSLDMINLARRNASKKGLTPPQVAFVHTSLTEPLPINSNTIDLIISNCVINLLPNESKKALFVEVHRILKPGGRLALSDIIAKKEMPDTIRRDLAAYVGCISGAITLNEYQGMLMEAGLTGIVFTDMQGDLNVYKSTAGASSGCGSSAPCCGPANGASSNLNFDANEWAASYAIFGVKHLQSVSSNNENPGVLARWWDAYPQPESSFGTITSSELKNMLVDNSVGVIDVRDDDYAGGHIYGSVQFAARSFYNRLAEFHNQYGHLNTCVFYCGSSKGRAPRCAGWYEDYRAELSLGRVSRVLEGGFTGWKAEEEGLNLVAY